jgi:acyl carrier protein
MNFSIICQVKTHNKLTKINDSGIVFQNKGLFMDKNVVFEKLKETMVREFNLDPASITPETLLSDDLEMDSLDTVDLINGINDFLNKKIDFSLFKTVKTVQDVADLLEPYWKAA